MAEKLTFFNYWTMSISAVSLMVSLTALIISVMNLRRANTAILRILDVHGYSNATRPAFNVLSHRLAMYVRNLGVPLHDVKLKLVLSATDGSGTLSIALGRYSIDEKELQEDRAELAKGMVGLFEARSEKYPPTFIEGLKRHREGKRSLEIYDCGYLIQTIRIGGWRDWFGSRWNRIAHTVNSRLNRTVIADDGHEMFKEGALVPTMRNWNAGVNYFLKERDVPPG
jgi:hypothetical protein